MNQVPKRRVRDRIKQIKEMLENGTSPKQIVEMGFQHLEVSKAKVALMQKQNGKLHQNKDTVYKPRNPGRCKECGGYGDANTFVNRVCLGCICREETNKVRCGRFRV
jgi:hypothetical protein